MRWAMRWSNDPPYYSHLIIMKFVPTYKVTKQRERNTKGANTPCIRDVRMPYLTWSDLESFSSVAIFQILAMTDFEKYSMRQVKHWIQSKLKSDCLPHRANLSTNNSNLTWYIPDKRVLFVCIWNLQVFTFVLILAAAHHVALMLTQNKHFL